MMNLNNIDSDIFKIETNNKQPQKSKILISAPFLTDDIFSRSVVLLVEHNDEEGTLGFVLNKFIPENYYPEELEKEYPFRLNLAYGGPVEMTKMFYIHQLPPDILPYSVEIMPNLYWGGDYAVLKDLILKGEVDPKNVRFFVGYSGWSPYQLQNELQRNDWIVGDITPEEVFNADENLWQKVLQKFDLKYKLWAWYPPIPDLN